MKKILGAVFVSLISLILSAGGAKASEGNITLSNPNVSCEGVSVWHESSYHVVGRCQGLVYPYDATDDHYVMWAKLDNGSTIRLDDIDRGYFEGTITNAFSSVLITAETSSSPRRPSTKQVLSGDVQAFDFDTTTTTAPVATPTPAPKTSGITVQQGATTQTGVTVGSVVGRILKALLVIVGVIILVAIIASLIFRRRGSVSA